MPICSNCGRKIAIDSKERTCPACGIPFLPVGETAQTAGSKAARWEYKEICLTPGCCERVLNEAGMDGWELVTIYNERIMGTDGFYAVLKRPIQR